MSIENILYNMSPKQVELLREEIYWARCEIARDDVNEFIELCFTDDDTQKSIKQTWFHKIMQNALPTHGEANVLFILPRGAGKSQQISVFRTIWELGRNPNLRIKIITATDDTAIEIVAAIKKAIESNLHVHNVFSHLRPSKNESWSTHQLVVERRSGTGHPSVEACSVLGTGAGGRSDLNIYDDVCDLMNSVLHPSDREKVIRAVNETWEPMLVPGSRSAWIATPYHFGDATNIRRHSNKWKKVIIPALIPKNLSLDTIIDQELEDVIIDPSNFTDGQSYWPEKWSMEKLYELYKDSPRSFERQYLLRVTVEEDRIFSINDIVKCSKFEYNINTEFYHKYIINPDWPRYAGVDLAASMGKKSAYTVMFTIAVDENDVKWPIEIIRKKQKFPDTINMIVEQYKKHNHTNIVVENNAYQQSVIDQIRSLNIDVPISAHHTGIKKMDEKIGLPALSAQLNRNRWVIPVEGCCSLGTDMGISLSHGEECVICAWLTELINAPYGQTSDIIMSMWMADAATKNKKTKLSSIIEPFMVIETSNLNLMRY